MYESHSIRRPHSYARAISTRRPYLYVWVHIDHTSPNSHHCLWVGSRCQHHRRLERACYPQHRSTARQPIIAAQHYSQTSLLSVNSNKHNATFVNQTVMIYLLSKRGTRFTPLAAPRPYIMQVTTKCVYPSHKLTGLEHSSLISHHKLRKSEQRDSLIHYIFLTR